MTRTRSIEMERRRALGRPACVALVALALLACTGESLGPAPAPPKLSPGDFASTRDLLRSIEQGSFTRRAGLTDEIEEATLPPPVTIAFVSGTEVPADQLDALRGLARKLEQDRKLAVDLEGCSDPSGSAALNKRISQARAESVARRLEQLGVRQDQLAEVVGHGEECDQQQRMVLATPIYAQRAAASGEQVGAQPDAAPASPETPGEA